MFTNISSLHLFLPCYTNILLLLPTELAEHEGETDYHAIDNLHTSTNTHSHTHTLAQGSLLFRPSAQDLDGPLLASEGPEGSHRTANSNFYSLNSSMTGVTSNTLPSSHPFNALPYNSSQFFSTSQRSHPNSSSNLIPSLSNRSRVTPLRGNNMPSAYPGSEEGHELGLSDEERQLQEDINRAIELSLIEQQLLDHHNESLKLAAANNNSASQSKIDPTETELANGKEDPSMNSDSPSLSARGYSPATTSKSPRSHAGLNRTYTDFSEGEIGIAGYAANIINAIPSNFNTANNDYRKVNAVLSTPPRSRQASQGALPGIHSSTMNSNNNTTITGAGDGMPKSPSKAMMDFSQPSVVGEEEENTEVLLIYICLLYKFLENILHIKYLLLAMFFYEVFSVLTNIVNFLFTLSIYFLIARFASSASERYLLPLCHPSTILQQHLCTTQRQWPPGDA